MGICQTCGSVGEHAAWCRACIPVPYVTLLNDLPELVERWFPSSIYTGTEQVLVTTAIVRAETELSQRLREAMRKQEEMK